MSTDRWIDKDDVVYISNGILLSHKVWNNAFCSNIDGLEIIMLSDVSQRHIILYYLYVESKIWHKWTYPEDRNRLTDREQTCGCQGGWGMDRLGVSG